MLNKNIFFSFFTLALFTIFYLPVNAETELDISFNNKVDFNQASTSDIILANLSESKFLAVYQDGGGNLNYGRIVIGEILNNEISYGKEYDFIQTNVSNIDIIMLSENKFVIAYSNGGWYDYGSLIIGEVDGSNIFFGQSYYFNENITSSISLIPVSDSKFIIIYSDVASGSYRNKAVVAQVQDKEVSLGNSNIFNYSNMDYVDGVALSEDSFIIAYEDEEPSKQGTCISGNISNNEISFGSEYVFNPTNTKSISIIKTEGNNFAIFYDDDGESSEQGKVTLGSVENLSVSFGGDYTFSSNLTGSVSVSAFDSNKVLIAYSNEDYSSYGEIVIGEISTDSIVFDSKKSNFYSSNTDMISVINLSKDNFVVGYRDMLNNRKYGTSVNGVISGFKIPEPEPIPEPESEPTPIPEPEPEPESITIIDGDLIRNPNAQDSTKFDIYIVKLINDKKFKRLILSPHVFESYEHLNWEDVKDINETIMNNYISSDLIRTVGDLRVYKLSASGDTGTKQWLNIMTEEFISQGYDNDSIMKSIQLIVMLM